MAVDFVAMLDAPWMGPTLDDRFVGVMDFHARNGMDYIVNRDRAIAKEAEAKAKREAEAVALANFYSSLGPHWRHMDDAPLDGTAVVGIAYDYGVTIAQVYYRAGTWWLHNHIGYDLTGDELQPVRWMPI